MVSFYQRVPVDFQQVVQGIHLIDGDNIAPVILGISPCRSGSTVLLRVFGASGVPAHFQPLKNVLRWAMQDKEWEWTFPASRTPILIKETLGPYTQLEAEFNPFQIFKTIGYPLEKLQVMLVYREPLQTWSSWYKVWGEKTRFDIFVAAYRQIETIRQQVVEAGLPVVQFVYEAVRDFGPESAIRDIFAQLKLPYISQAIMDWDQLPAFAEPGSNIFFPVEHELFYAPYAHERAMQASHLQYFAGAEPLPGCTPEVVTQVEALHLNELYAFWRKENYSRIQKMADYEKTARRI